MNSLNAKQNKNNEENHFTFSLTLHLVQKLTQNG